MITNLAKKLFLLIEENAELVAKIKALEKQLYDKQVQIMHLENQVYSK